MTRRRIIAGVILLAVVAVAVPLVPGVWEKVAYREMKLDDGFVVYPKRWKWLPGQPAYVPDQLCESCLCGEHDYCWRISDSELFGPNGGVSLWKVMAVRSDPNDPDTAYFSKYPCDFRCTCTDPSHDGER